MLCYLFDALVRPVLEYGNVVWGCYPAEELEILHKRFCKFALGVPRSATNLACYGELGRTPLMIKRKISMIKYWLRVTTDWDAPELVKDSYALAKAESHEWVSFIQNTLNNSGFSQVWNRPSGVVPTEFTAQLEQRLIDQYIQCWQGELRDSTGKLRSYRLIKNEFHREMYLTLPPYLRVPHTRLRISAHALRIETGRYNLPAPLPVQERTCWFCSEEQAIEDEVHFLFSCSLYTQERQEFFDYSKQINKSFPYLTDIDKWRFMSRSNDKHLIYLLSKFISVAFEKRAHSH